jgi:hypothetical protein
MEPADESVFAWIGGGGDILAGYSHEVRVLHMMVEDISVEDHLVTWDQWEKESGERDKWLARLKRKGESGQFLASALAQSKPVGGTPSSGFPGRRIRWREIAEREGVRFEDISSAGAIWRALPRGTPRYLVGADREGQIDPLSAAGIVRALQSAARPGQCFFHFFAGIAGGWDPPFVLKGQVDDVLTFSWPRAEPSPDYWWPQDQSWLVHTDYDSTVTSVAGGAALIDALEADPEAETVRLR